MKNEKSICDSIFEKKSKLPVCCVVAAAGQSVRMGVWKGELPVPSVPLINNKLRSQQVLMVEKVVKAALESCEKVIIVAGEKKSRMRELFTENESLIILENTEFRRGMLSSIQRAMSEVNHDFFIVPMDMPLIDSKHYYKIHREYSISKSSKIFRPVFMDQPGHPVFFPLCWKERILEMKGSSLKSNITEDDQNLVHWEDESVVLDLDTCESYERFIKTYSSPSD